MLPVSCPDAEPGRRATRDEGKTVSGHPATLARIGRFSFDDYLVAMTELTVWHDGSCPLCRREIALMRRLDTRHAIRFVDAASDDGSGCPLEPATMLARFHAEENGRLVSGAAAFAAMWRVIPLLRPLGVAARNPWALAGLERLYRVFLKLRPTLQSLLTRWDRRHA